MNINRAHCLFEQSGTFKNEFKKLGIDAIDYDIQNEFGETDCVSDLFEAIDNAYENKPSIFDDIRQEDVVMAFFPCTRFEDQIIMCFRGDSYQIAKWSDKKKIEYAMNLERERERFYHLVCKMFTVAIDRGLKLIMENPYSKQNYLERYFPIKPKVIDMDRTIRGDYYIKPTQYWFINCEPENNFIFEPQVIQLVSKRVVCTHNKTERSMIAPEYANRFIREFILSEEK